MSNPQLHTTTQVLVNSRLPLAEDIVLLVNDLQAEGQVWFYVMGVGLVSKPKTHLTGQIFV